MRETEHEDLQRVDAEPYGVLADVIEECGGIDNCAPWVVNLNTWKDGRYIPATEVAAKVG